MRRASVSVIGAASLGLALIAACTTDYHKGLGDPNFGAPNALAGQKQPGPSSDNTPRDGGGGGGQPKCVESGGALVDGGACAVSFKTDILASFSTAGCQAATCHGGSNPQYEPKINPDDPTGTWNVFANFTLSNPAKLYINPCSTDPAESTIACNVNGAAKCGTLMPSGSAAGLDSTIVTMIEDWLKCGAPNN